MEFMKSLTNNIGFLIAFISLTMFMQSFAGEKVAQLFLITMLISMVVLNADIITPVLYAGWKGA